MSDKGELAEIRDKVVREVMRRAENGLELCDSEFVCLTVSLAEG